LKIAVLSDPHLGFAKQHFVANGRTGIELINASGADLCIVLGDLTLNGADSLDDCLFARDEIAKIRCDVRVLPGNHDVGDVSRSGRQPVDDIRLDRWRKVFGPTFWTMDTEQSLRLIGLNSQILSTGLAEEDAQWRMVEQSLSSADGRRIIMFLHQPLFMHDWDEIDRPAWAVLDQSRQRLKALFVDHGVELIICAHVHRAQVLDEPGMPKIVWTPATSFLSRNESMPQQSGAEMLGVTILDLQKTEPEVSFLSSAEFEITYIEDSKGKIYAPPGS